MDNGEEPDESSCTEEKDNSGVASPSSSLGSSLSTAQEFRRQMKAPNKKKFDEEMEDVAQQIKAKDAALRSFNTPPNETITAQLRDLKSEKEASINKRKKIDGELRNLNQEITKKMGLLSRTESNLHYKNEGKIDDAIRNMEWQLKTQNFRLQEERKIVAEVDKLRRSKKVLAEYFTQKKEVDKMREGQRRMRGERDHFNKAITNISRKEDELRKKLSERKSQSTVIRNELDVLYEKKRQLFAEFKQSEQEYQKMLVDIRIKKKKDSIKKKEEERKAKDEAYRREMLEYQAQTEPFEDEKNLCNTLITYLQRYLTSDRDEPPMLPSPREERPDTVIGAAPGPADSLDDGMFVRLKKSEEPEPEYTITTKRQGRRSKKGRKLSVTKPLAHTPQIIAQFASLNLSAPSNMAEVPASVEQLQARKRYYEEQSGLARPMLGSLGSSFSSSGSMSSLESPLRERSSTWGYVEVPPSIAENQAPSDAGTSAGESGFHDMSRQASKTESSESATEIPCDQALEEMIRQSEDLGESEHSRSSSDTITYDDLGACGGDAATKDSTTFSENNNSFDSSVFEEGGGDKGVYEESHLRGDNSNARNHQYEKGMNTRIANYDQDFPPALRPPLPSDRTANDSNSESSVLGVGPDSEVDVTNSPQTSKFPDKHLRSDSTQLKSDIPVIHIDKSRLGGELNDRMVVTDKVDLEYICAEDIVTHL